MTYDINALIAQAAKESLDMNEKSTGGGGATPPVAGTCLATLIGVVELGRRLKKGHKGAPDKKVRKARLTFELAGGTNPHTQNEDKTASFAKRVNVNVWLPEPGRQPHAKSAVYKLMSKLNYAKDDAIRILAQCIGKHYKVVVSVEEFTNDAGEVIKYGSLGGAEEGYRISPPQNDITDDDGMPTGQVRLIAAPEVIGETRVFLWDYANKAMWDALFIEGEYEATEAADGKPAKPAKSKNIIQEELMQALDWVGSPMQTILAAGGELETGEIETVREQGDADDALAGLV